MTSTPAKYLVCRPSGGLTDTLCQIEKCWRYARLTRRILVIDARQSGLWAPFSDYFELEDRDLEVVPSPDSELFSRLDGMTCFPAAMRGRLQSYACRWDSARAALVDAESNTPLTFDFAAVYADDVLLHHQAGGGPDQAFALLQRVVLVDSLASECRRIIDKFGCDYDAIHIRNSDYRTDWQPFLREIAARLGHTSVLVCSDDVRVLRFAQEFFRDKRVLVSSSVPDTQGKALHTHEFPMSDAERHSVVRDAIIDLVALAAAASLWYPNTVHGYPSGYSALAALLQKDRSVLRRLIAGAPGKEPQQTTHHAPASS